MAANIPPPAKRGLRVAQLVDELAPAGGIEEALVTLAGALEREDCASVVFSCQAVPADNDYARRLRAAGTPVHAAPGWLAWARQRVPGLARAATLSVLAALWPLSAVALTVLVIGRRENPRRAWQRLVGRVQQWLPVEQLVRQAWQGYLNRWLRREAISVVHVHGYGCGAVPAGGLTAAVATGWPVIYTEHGMPWPELAGRADLRAALAGCRQLIAISQASADALRRYGSVSGAIHLVRHVVPDLRTNARPTRTEAGPVFGCVAMLRADKGHTHWLRSMPAVIAQYPTAHFVMVGDGAERASLEAEARQLGIDRHVVFLGRVAHSDLGQLLSQWDVFVLPSPNEPLGIVVVEAMAAGLPIVAAAAGGVLDLVRHEATALLVTPADSAALSTAQLRLAADAELRLRLGRAARQAYSAGPFTPERVGSAVAQLYRAAVADAPAAVLQHTSPVSPT